ncbi:S1C family serine protease [Paenibacillus methanolicus]|uniref:Serine protease Do n=1 Tax=Paenibacillus methanolicus TaxID=582686 RepID=A0A5S5CBK0_9BACL|nr:trypsin-like peptidase domain-containing protein [Paenibacillus methanolicus]TYP75373.1 serine protease Do [Paenibacillus methanolicus]
MSLFDDDFYSTRVSRRVRSSSQTEDRRFLTRPRRSSRSWSQVRLAAASSLVSAAAVVLLFGLFTGGFDRGSGPLADARPAVATVQTTDPLEKTVEAAGKVRPAVVSIINEQSLAVLQGEAPEETTGEEELTQAALGSGVIFEKENGKAHIITNAHVVADAAALKAVLSTGEVREATLIGADTITDLAVLEIDAGGIDTVAEIGDSKELRAGQVVMAIGNPLGLSDSLTMGIVSKTERVIPVSLAQDGVYDWEQEVIQVDASINQGNSGGPLIDLNGRVMGINSMKVSDFGVEGVGFAIPTNEAMPIVQSLLDYGKVKRPYLGVYTMDVDQYLAQQEAASLESGGHEPEEEGATGEDEGAYEEDASLPQADLKLPEEVDKGVIVLEAVGPAADAGLAFNDVIVKLDKQTIGSTLDLRKYLYEAKEIGQSIDVTFYRDGERQTLTLELREKTEDE